MFLTVINMIFRGGAGYIKDVYTKSLKLNSSEVGQIVLFSGGVCDVI